MENCDWNSGGEPVDKNSKVFDWECSLSIPDGGLVETKEEFNFEALHEGYAPTIEIKMVKGENWQGDIQRKFYIKLPDGRYGRIEFRLMTWNGVFQVHSFINPSSSRNLEFDPKKMIQPND